MKKQSGVAHIAIVVVLVVLLLGALGLIFWKTIEVDRAKAADTESSKTETKQTLSVILNGKQVTVDVSDSDYTDIVAVLNTEKSYYDIYSKDLLARLNTANGSPKDSVSGCNATVTVFTYPADDVSGEQNKVGEIDGAFVHAGFMGPCDSTLDEDLNEEMFSFRDYIVEKVTEAVS